MVTARPAATFLTRNLTKSARLETCQAKIPSTREPSYVATIKFTPTDTRMRVPTSTTSLVSSG